MSILVTGAAGFIGFHLSRLLLEKGFSIIGFDNLNDYYDKSLKIARLNELKKLSSKLNLNFKNIESNLEDYDSLNNVFQIYKPSIVINLAAQAGVRYSLLNPSSYIQSNLVGFGNVLEATE